MYSAGSPSPNKKRWPKYLLALLVLTGIYSGWCLLRPLPAIKPEDNVSLISFKTSPSSLAWPSAGQAAVSTVGDNKISTNGTKQFPTASTAKLITALTVLNAKPLQPGQTGQELTITANDVAIYQAYAAKDGSVVKVVEGEKLNQNQMLQALMLPSSNNIADSMAIWAFGSLEKYAVAANSYLRQNGIYHTTVGSDASGLAATTTSSAEDLVRIGKLTMQNPALAQIVGLQTVNDFPVVGTIKNVNYLLGNNGIVGIKTGNSDEAGGAFVGAKKIKVNGKDVTITSAVVGAPNLASAMTQSLALLNSFQQNFETVEVIKPGKIVGKYLIPWSNPVNAVSAGSLSVDYPKGSSFNSLVSLKTQSAGATKSSKTGQVTVKSSAYSDPKSVDAVLAEDIPKPSISWKLTHPLN